MADEDWRVRLSFTDDSAASAKAEEIVAREVESHVAEQMGNRIAVSNDGRELFLYSGSEDAARAAYEFVRSEIGHGELGPEVELTRWHDEAEEWVRADRPLPATDAEHAAEYERLVREEDQETAQEGYAQWEARLELPTLAEARKLSRRLEEQGVPHVRRFRHLAVGAPDEDAARQWADRLRAEAPEGTEVRVEGTFASASRSNPFAALGLGGFGGGAGT